MLYRKLGLIAMNKLEKIWLHSTFSVKFHGYSVRKTFLEIILDKNF